MYVLLRESCGLNERPGSRDAPQIDSLRDPHKAMLCIRKQVIQDKGRVMGKIVGITVALFLFAVHLAQVRGTIVDEESRALLDALNLLPGKVEEILRTVTANAGHPYGAVHELIEAANDAGGKDNVSVVLLRYTE